MHTLRGWIFYLWFSITLIPAATTVLLLWPFAGVHSEKMGCKSEAGKRDSLDTGQV